MIRPGIAARFVSCGIVLLLTFEVCARLDDTVTYGAPFWKPYNIEQIYEFDSLGRRGKPNARFRKWKLNSLGYRGPELTPGSPRIVVLGASETFGLYEQPDHEFPRLLEQKLKERGETRFEVVNAAYAGMPITAMIQRVPEIAQRLQPRYALIYPTPATYIWLPWLRPERQPAQPVFDIRVKELIRTVSKQLIPFPVQNWVRTREITAAAPVYGRVMSRLPQGNIDRFVQDLRRLTNVLRSRGIEPILVTHASRFHNPLTEEDREVLLSWRKFYPMLEENGFLDMERRVNDAIRAEGALNQYTVVDAAALIPPGSRYFADFTHFTDEGSQKMSEILAERLYPVVSTCCAPMPQLASNPNP